jgi:hypothetical protein
MLRRIRRAIVGENKDVERSSSMISKTAVLVIVSVVKSGEAGKEEWKRRRKK